MEDLVAIALMYSYVANGERELADYTLSTYISKVKDGLAKLRSKYDINEGNSNGFYENVPCTINVRSDDGEVHPWSPSDKKFDPCSRKYINQPTLYYSFSSINPEFLGWFHWLNPDLVCATLDKEALDHLDVKREDLPIKSDVNFRTGETSIYSLVEKEAREKALRYLEEDGFKDVSVGSGHLTKPDDYAYKFYFTAKKEIDSLNTNDPNISKKVENLRIMLDMEDYKRKALSMVDKDGKLNLENLFLAETVLIDKDNNEKSCDYRVVLKDMGDEGWIEEVPKVSYDVTVFIDLLGDEVMYYFWSGRYDDTKFERVVENITPLSKAMEKTFATLEEIENFINSYKLSDAKLELKPQK